MSYTVLYSENGITKDISDFVTGIQYGGDVQTAVRKLNISLLSGTDVFIPRLDLRNGGLLTLFSDAKELIRAVIFKQDKNGQGEFNITAYTHGIYLTKNKDTKIFTQVKATQIVQQICDEFGIPAGEVADTQMVLPKLILRDKTLWDMVLIALTETTNKNGVKYRVFFKEGKLNVSEKSKQYVPWVLEQGVNLISASKSASIEDMKNKIKVIGKLPQDNNGNERICVVENSEMQRLYGILQELKEESGDQVTESSLRQTAENMLKELCKEQIEAEVEAVGIDDVEAGMAVYVIESTTGLTGTYYVDQDDHSIEGNKHTMRLKLAWTDEVPKLEYDGEQVDI